MAAPTRFAGAVALKAEHQDLEKQLADPDVHADQDRARKLGKRYAELTPIIKAYDEWVSANEDIATVKEMAEEDPDSADEILGELPDMEQHAEEAAEKLRHLLLPRDPDDGRDVILEVKAGEGGDESALFAGDLLRMYLRFAEVQGWRTEILDNTESDLGGIKSATVAVKRRGTGAAEDGVWAHLKYEGGVHRVQRVPVTESQGRIHTSAAGVLAMPEPEETGEIEIDPNEIRIDVYRSSGPGGQSVNTTDSAVRITHIPTGIVASCQNEKSQIQNREAAMRILRARLLAQAQEEAEAEAEAARRSQIRTVDRSERIRTYNFPENRITDHRTGYKAYNLDAVLDGELEPVVRSAIDADAAAKLAAAGDD